MLTNRRFLIIFLSLFSIFSHSSSPLNVTLWHQIIPLVGNIDITKAKTRDEALKACTAQAMLTDGSFYPQLDSEMLQTMESLHLFSHVLPKICHNNLRLGQFMFAKNMCQVTDNLEFLHKKTAYNLFLCTHSNIADDLNITLKDLKKSEDDFLVSFYAKPPKEAKQEDENIVEKGIEAYENAEKKIFSNRFIGEAYNRMTQLTSVLFIYASASSLFGWNNYKKIHTKTIDANSILKTNDLSENFDTTEETRFNFQDYCTHKIGEFSNFWKPIFGWNNYTKPNVLNESFDATSMFKDMPGTPSAISFATIENKEETRFNFQDYCTNKIGEFSNFWKPIFGEKISDAVAANPVLATSWIATCVLGTTLMTFNTMKELKSKFDLSYKRNKSLFLLKDLLTASKKIVAIVEKNPELEKFLSNYATIKHFAHYTAHKGALSEKMVHLIGLLDFYPFNSEPKYFISWQGKIHETFLLYEEIHHELMPLWQAVAEIDAQLCTYKLLHNELNNFCIPQWVNQEKPLFDLQGYWHPMISYTKAVRNDIALGTTNTASNAVITGANAGGKTTSMTAMMLCAILGQSIGIVPAKKYRATPFARMHTYLDITTNLAQNESLFMAQANRAKHLSDSIKNCKGNQKALTILDEIFTGTRADFAENASYRFALSLGQMTHSICIIATHFPKMTELEKTNLFMNYQAAAATIHDDGSLTYPYLIIPGISTQNIADYILKNKGVL